MLEAIRSRDFTLHYSLDKLKGEERRLAEEINAVVSEFRETQARQEAQYGQYETLLNQVNAMLFVEDCKGNVLWMNRKAVDELCGFSISRLDMLATVHPSLPDELNALKAGQQRLLHLRIADREVDWSVSMTRYFRMGEEARLFSIENIQTLVQQSEVESQKKLVSVLTHEIMNSLAPIISLSEESSDTALALSVIHRRSTGLLQFVENYRKLSRLAQPKKEMVKVGDLIADLQSLFPSTPDTSQAPAPHIIYNIEDPTEELFIDRHQMTQVLINLLKNAEESFPAGDSPLPTGEGTGERQITLTTRADRRERHFLITVADNGEGILPEVLDRIFVPFFTTKPGGSGIGLALCRQIITMHSGLILVKTTPATTHFTIQLPL